MYGPWAVPDDPRVAESEAALLSREREDFWFGHEHADWNDGEREDNDE